MQTPISSSSQKQLFKGMPDAFVILFFVILLAAAATYLLPAGQFDTEQVSKVINGQTETRTQLVAGSFNVAEKTNSHISWFASGGDIGIMNYAFEGLVSGDKWGSAVGVIAFILIVGGAFGIIMESGAINNGILALINKSRNAGYLILPLMFVLFSLAGAIFGMGEEAIAFCIVLVPLVIALGYDAITAVLITYVATQIGFATSWMNPFSVAIAQGIADVPLFSGEKYRMLLWCIFTTIGLIFTLRYAKKIKAKPEASLSHQSDDYFRQKQGTLEVNFGPTDIVILSTFFMGIVWVIWGVTQYQYYIPEIASQFFTIGIVVAVIAVVANRMSMNQASRAFQQGAKDLLPAALIVGMAKGIVLVLGGSDPSQASVLNTLLYHASEAIGGLGATVSALLMFVFQSIFNFFVASGSGQAAITMPLMAPLSDLVGVSRQISVLAFQLGDGLTNIIIPTSASLIGCLGVARIDWSTWLKFIWKPILLLLGTAALSLVIAVMIGYH
ncbi:MAG: putative basic amino acid antiporter YfcC [Paraglaciecola sp.]|nr:putative basic amino acid antiporter YfcC [Paraglaciecola sp.]